MGNSLNFTSQRQHGVLSYSQHRVQVTDPLRSLSEPVHRDVPPDPSRFDPVERVSLPFEREQLDFFPESPERVKKCLSLHVDHPAVLEAEQQQHGHLHVAHVGDGRGRVQLRVQLRRQLLALRGWLHAKLEEVPVWDVGARWLGHDHWVAQHRCGERVWVLPDDCGYGGGQRI